MVIAVDRRATVFFRPISSLFMQSRHRASTPVEDAALRRAIALLDDGLCPRPAFGNPRRRNRCIQSDQGPGRSPSILRPGCGESSFVPRHATRMTWSSTLRSPATIVEVCNSLHTHIHLDSLINALLQ